MGVNVLPFRRAALDAVFIVTEGIAWFLAIAVVTSMLERAFLEDLATSLRLAIGAGEVSSVAAAQEMLAVFEERPGGNAGPPLPVILLTATGGFLLTRAVRRLDLGPGLGSVVLLLSTVLAVNLLLHLAVGSLTIWDAGELIARLEDPAARAPGAMEAFVARGDADGLHAGALGFAAAGLAVTWGRFLFAGRTPVNLERMTRSFTASFAVVLGAIFVAQVGDVAVSGLWAIPQFAVGLLGLSIANHERAVPAGEGGRRASPWMTSVGSTLGMLLAAAGVLALLAYLRFGVVLSAAGDVLLVVVEFALYLVITPLYWILERIILLLIGSEGLDRLPRIIDPLNTEELVNGEDRGAGLPIPDWFGDSVAFLAGVLVVYLLYRVGRGLIGRRPDATEEFEEVRSTTSGGAGIGRLLGDLARLRRRPNREGWFGRHASYRLFGRALRASYDRGLSMLPAETPSEFGGAAITHLAAQPVADAARLFDRARYGRHFPTAEEIRVVDAALDRWEELHPATEELRERVRGVRPLTDFEEFNLRIAMARNRIRVEEQRVIQERRGRRSRRGRVDRSPE